MDADSEVSDIGRRRGAAMLVAAAVAVLLPLVPVLVATTGLPALGRLAPIPGLVVAAIVVVKTVAACAGGLAELRRRPWVAATPVE